MASGLLQDVRVKRGVDVGNEHNLVTTNFKLKFMKQATVYRVRRFDTRKVRGSKKKKQTKHEFKLELNNRFRILEDLDESDEYGFGRRELARVQKTYRVTNEKILGYRRQVQKEWITLRTWNLIDERGGGVWNREYDKHSQKDWKDRLREQYSGLQQVSETKRTLRKDNKDYSERLAQDA